MNWPKSIITAFIIFAGFIGVLVTVCIRQDVSLVDKNYYKDELIYDQQLQRIGNTASLADKPAIRAAKGGLEIVYPDFQELESGELSLYAPADERQDRSFPLAKTSAPAMLFPLHDVKGGLYKVRMTWTMHGKEFYHEQVIYL